MAEYSANKREHNRTLTKRTRQNIQPIKKNTTEYPAHQRNMTERSTNEKEHNKHLFSTESHHITPSQ